MASVKDYVHLNFIVVIWGFTAILGLLITIPAVEVVFYRTFISAIAIASMMWLAKTKFNIGSANIIKLLLTGGVVSGHWILFFASARVSNASVSLIGLATVALWTSIIDPLVNKRQIKLFEVFLGLIIIVGLYIIYNVNLDYKLGLFMAVISALLAAIFSVINGRMAQKHHHFTITLYEMIGAFAVILICTPAYTSYFSESGAFVWQLGWADFFYLIVLALVCTVYAFSASVELLKRISVFASNLTIHMEPIYGIILAVLFFQEHEQLNTGFYLGSAIIVLAVFSYPVVKFYKNRKMRLR